MTTPFTADSGTYQGRIIPTGWSAPDGDYVFCLGHDLPGQTVTLNAGDSVSLTQAFDATNKNMVAATIRVRPPSAMPSDTSWRLIVGSVDYEYAVFIISAGGRAYTLTDIAIPTLFGTPTFALVFTLYLEGTAGEYEVELPGVYIDACLSSDAAFTPQITCRYPSPDDSAVEDSPAFKVLVNDVDLVGLTNVVFSVNGSEIAEFNGANANTLASVASGWSAESTLVAPSAVWYEFQKSTPFDSEETVEVSVLASTAASTTASTWSFAIADTAGPRVISALATSVFELSVEWNEAIADDSLDAAMFTITLESNPPAYVPNVVDVLRDPSPTHPTWIVLRLDQPATPGATYLVTASADVTDALGNAVEADYASATFDAYQSPMTPANRLLSLYQELPAAERDTDQFGELKLFCDVLDEGLRALAVVADDWPLVTADPDTALEPWLDAILWELGNPFDWLPMDIRTKRLLARWMHALVALKGSGLGIRAAIRLLLGIETQVHVYGVGLALLGLTVLGETFVLGTDDEDDLYTFWVIVDAPLDAETRNYMNRIIDIMKVANERHLIVEPGVIVLPDHWALGFSELGTETELHA
jgi:phage tail-like protein